MARRDKSTSRKKAALLIKDQQGQQPLTSLSLLDPPDSQPETLNPASQGAHSSHTHAHYAIRDVVALTGVPASTLRFWEERHRLLAPARAVGGMRLYSDADIQRIRLIQYVIQTRHLSLPAVASLLPAQEAWPPVESLRALAQKHDEADTLTQLATAQQRIAAYERWRDALAQAAEAITSTLDLEVVVEQIVSVVCSFLGVQSAWLMVYDDEVHVLRLKAISGWQAIPVGAEFLPGASLAGEIFLSGRPLFVPDVRKEPRFALKQEAAEAGIVAMLGVPLLVQGKAVGVLGLNPCPEADGVVRNPLEGPDGEWLRLFAVQAGIAIQNARLYERAQTGHALAEQLARGAERHARELETIIESMAEGVAVFDTRGRVIRLNRMGAALAGISSAQVLALPPTAQGTAILERLEGTDFALACQPLVRRALAGEVVKGETLLLARIDGRDVELQVSAAPLLGEGSQLHGAVAILEDVTDQQQHQREQLAVGWVAAALNHPLDLKETLDTAVEALTAALGADQSVILLADRSQGVLKVAAARGPDDEEVAHNFPLLPIDAPLVPCQAFRMRKVQFSELDRESLFSSSHPLLRLLAKSGIQATLAAPLLLEDEALGVLVYSYERPHRFSAAEQQTARAIADQIALTLENARLYEEVADYGAWQAAQSKTLQAVIDALPAGVTLRDSEGKLFMYNAAALALAANCAEVQASREMRQSAVEPIWDVVSEEGEAAPLQVMPSQEAVLSGNPIRGQQLLLRQSDGRLIPVLVNAAPVYGAQGKPTSGVAVFQDITELKELERHKDEFISVASHELRSPLTVIRGQAQLLQRQLRRQEKQAQLPPVWQHFLESMEGIEAQTGRMNDLVNDLLDVSKIQAGKLTLRLALVPLMPLLARVLKHWEPISPNHQFVLELGEQIDQIVGQWDATRVEQVLNNLVGNAVKYSPEGGKITIRGQVLDQQVLLQIQDEGLGIPPEALPHLFERFYRAVNVGMIGGTGLGLYISHQLAVAHGGTLWPESAGVGKGSTFSLCLPLT
ncbi:MAG TPA: GAF domain-containing protein [Ktedonobacterales bacterium]